MKTAKLELQGNVSNFLLKYISYLIITNHIKKYNKGPSEILFKLISLGNTIFHYKKLRNCFVGINVQKVNDWSEIYIKFNK